MVPIESKEEKEMTKTKIYDTAFYEAVEFAGDCLTVKVMKESMYDYIFNNENPFDNEADYNTWILGSIRGFEYAIHTTECMLAAEDEWISVA